MRVPVPAAVSQNDAGRRMISPGFVEDALACVRARGLDPTSLLATAGLPSVVREPVSAEQYGVLWREIALALDDEFLTLGLRPMRPGSFTLLCQCVLHCVSLEQALRRALRFLNVMLEEPAGELTVTDGVAEIILRERGPARSAFAYRTYWIILHGIACWLVGRRISLRLVDFRCGEPDRGAEYRQFFGAPVAFGQSVSRLAFDAEFLRLPVIRQEKALKEFLQRAPANILVRYRHDAGLTAGVRRRLRDVAPVQWPRFEDLARQMRLPSSTLRRRLREEGQSYQSIKDEIRRDRAMALLAEGTRPVAEIAEALGFAEPSAFHRAFRKWAAMSPAAFRRSRSVAPGP
ncbi:AraC family transcriptional regulator [Xanthobacter sp. VNH20]|uniref:AraC family transcriptional regulator n=1 Tax=Xanthobacter sp. VNH20 TaxID=3156616 RepID=UPI0032B3130F